MGLRSHPTRSVTHEALTTTLPFARSDKPVYTTVSITPLSRCSPTQAMAGPIFFTAGIPIQPFWAEFKIFTEGLYPGLGRLHGGFPDLGYLDLFRTQAPHQYFGAQGGNAGEKMRPNQVNDPWYILAVLTGKPEFGAPNYPVRALRYYHRYMTENP